MNACRRTLGWVLGLVAGQALAGCYTVYNPDDSVAYQGQTPPVDMSRPIHETLPARFPGGHLVFDTAGECPVISSVAFGNGGPNGASRTPLLTDRRMAQVLRRPYTPLGNDIALVPPRP